jgi:hypothetical protein
MKLQCQKCNLFEIKYSLLNSGDNLHCRNCLTRYSYKNKHPWFSRAVHLIAVFLSSGIGLHYFSWILCLITYLVITLASSFFYSNEKVLLPTGFRAKDKL